MISTKQPVITERLVHILQSIALKQLTGRLSIEHAREHQSEKGEIFFVQGDTVFAHTEHETGEIALSRMMNWREVHYCFFEGVRAPTGTSYRNRVVQRSRQTRPLLPIELEQTHPLPAISVKPEDTSQTPAIGMPAIPKSVRPSPITTGFLSTRQNYHNCSIPLPQTECSTSLPTDPYRLPTTKNPALHDFATPLPSPIPPLEECVEKIGQHGSFAIFRALPQATRQNVIYQMERRVRVVFLLLDGRRTVRDVAHLVHRSELDVARIIVHLLKQGYIKCCNV